MADKMSKKIKFALIMHGHEVRTMNELQRRFSLGDLLDDFMDLREGGEKVNYVNGYAIEIYMNRQ